eukprot:TRINITY_DN2179_c0_g3_i1.p1 TRINITY_DN2179_c0_g3~~TRINITY_DN2179_c0_g3_i1.p1  ORF type:complete len:194 (+),score=31.22 TRINITY_DN2179_c0_g3_i1:42-623(+)
MPHVRKRKRATLTPQTAQKRRRTSERSETVEEPLENKTDQELMRNHEIVNPKRYSMGFKLFVCYKEFTVRVWWPQNSRAGIVNISSAHVDSTGCTNSLTFHAKSRIKPDEIKKLCNALSSQGWINAPNERYIEKVEKIGISLPFKVLLPASLGEIKKLMGEDDNIKWVDFTIIEENPVQDNKEENIVDEDGFL